MGYEIKWTPTAKSELFKIINYLKREWTSKEIINLHTNISRLENLISQNPENCPLSSHKHNFSKGVIDKNNFLVYEIIDEESRINVLDFGSTKQFPKY